MTKINDPNVGFYRKKTRFLSVNGLVLYRTLSKIVGDQAIVFANAHAPAVLQPQKGLPAVEQQKQISKLESIFFDFVLCSPHNFSYFAVVHGVEPGRPNINERAMRSLMDSVCESADLPLVRIEYQPEYHLDEIKDIILPLIPKPNESRPTNTHLAGIKAHVSHNESYIELPETAKPSAAPSASKAAKPSVVDAKPCPKCGSKLAIRTSKSGKNKGARFIVCTDYPICSFIKQIKPAGN